MSEFTVVYDRNDRRHRIGSPNDTTTSRISRTVGCFAMKNGDQYELQLVNWATHRYVGSLEDLEEMAQQIVLAIDYLKHPTERVVSGTAPAYQSMEGGPT